MTLPVEKKSFLDVADVRRQVNLIQQLLTEVMKPEEHFGKIPGSGKPTLYKAGAEKILFTFRLACKYHILKSVHEKNFISYIIECTLTHIPTGNFVASGIGSCNSREKKYRYTFIPSNKRPAKEEANKLKIQGMGKWRKSGNDWIWMERVENDNPWDLDNTLLKMACKRALIAATLNATASSDIFVQDYNDDLDDSGNDNGKIQTPQTNSQQSSQEMEVDIASLDKELAVILDIDTLSVHWRNNEQKYKKCKNYKEIVKVYNKYKTIFANKEVQNAD
jgi:hypothetical protein